MRSVGSNSSIWPKYSPREKMIMLIMPAGVGGGENKSIKKSTTKLLRVVISGCQLLRLPAHGIEMLQ